MGPCVERWRKKGETEREILRSTLKHRDETVAKLIRGRFSRFHAGREKTALRAQREREDENKATHLHLLQCQLRGLKMHTRRGAS